jgi:aminoglycoside 3-N-acetyltransferase I
MAALGLDQIMLSSTHFDIHQLAPNDAALMEAMLTMFGEAFGEAETYKRTRPRAAYLERLLGSDSFIALAALKGGEVVGGIAAYELHKFEQERSEIYIYDLAVAAARRREGIARALRGHCEGTDSGTQEDRGGARGLCHFCAGRSR